MRHIKFRAWDGEKMVCPGDGSTDTFLARYNNGAILSVDLGYIDHDWSIMGYHWFNSQKTNKPLTLQQFTGLIDRNGKDIYEGDIVRVTASGNPNTNDIDYTAKIEWYNEGFSFYVKFKSGGASHSYGLNYKSIYHTNSAIEIIGNVFENPELLN